MYDHMPAKEDKREMMISEIYTPINIRTKIEVDSYLTPYNGIKLQKN